MGGLQKRQRQIERHPRHLPRDHERGQNDQAGERRDGSKYRRRDEEDQFPPELVNHVRRTRLAIAHGQSLQILQGLITKNERNNFLFRHFAGFQARPPADMVEVEADMVTVAKRLAEKLQPAPVAGPFHRYAPLAPAIAAPAIARRQPREGAEKGVIQA